MSSGAIPITDQRHNEYVGGDASSGRIPGTEKATTGHNFVSVFPKEDQPQKAKSGGVRRPEEHLPPPTGRDAPPASYAPPPVGDNIREVVRGEQPRTTRQRAGPSPPPHIPKLPLAPAPDSITVVDRSPYAEPTTAADTMTGATSQDVHRGYGAPGSGMTSAEMHHDGQQHRKRQGQGVETYGQGEIPRNQAEMD